MDEQYGARIERGRVQSVSKEGARIASIDRDGVQTPPLKALSSLPLAEGDFVYFFLFDDGRGRVLDRFEMGE